MVGLLGMTSLQGGNNFEPHFTHSLTGRRLCGMWSSNRSASLTGEADADDGVWLRSCGGANGRLPCKSTCGRFMLSTVSPHFAQKSFCVCLERSRTGNFDDKKPPTLNKNEGQKLLLLPGGRNVNADLVRVQIADSAKFRSRAETLSWIKTVDLVSAQFLTIPFPNSVFHLSHGVS
ncbi:hypothetical protein N657DRAFT_157431 [Parathielavia appendiculata]|uniref:Uncharacterized protein n=1 Tax=Parathielavia appendiculata TaxID=2587402 RepID=A0AAN6TUM9_9PEZI|nr:hypothetical protein N657DRAFT_157431 [Parathielavia appendiculata]